MDIVTAWVKPPTQIGGLDHLAVQAPGINIYGRLLPGITNVSDRARYYSFYPWLIWALEQAGYSTFDDKFIDAFRKADGLFTLVAHRHAAVCGNVHEDHAGATVGSANMAQHIAAIERGEEVELMDYAHRESGKQKYFKNKLGGLGQYYLGVLAELSVLDGTSSSGIRYTRQLGLPLVKAMDSGVPRELFIQTVNEGKVSSQRLDELMTFCPCQLAHSSKEYRLLRELFFAQNQFEDIEAEPRRSTLRMLLRLSDTLAKLGLPLDAKHFRGSIYSGAMPDGSPWLLEGEAKSIRELWAVYQRSEVLSVCVQGLFFAVLDAYQDSGLVLDSGRSVAQWYVKGSGELAPLNNSFEFTRSFAELVAESEDWLPPYDCWGEPSHEIALTEEIVALCGSNKSASNRVRIVEASVRTLIALCRRPESQAGYGSIVFPGNYFYAYPVNLASLLNESDKRWADMKLDDLLVWLFSRWGIDAHLRVALRKLRGQSKSTFRIRPTDHGLEVVDVPPAVHTSPRFNQAVRVLKDLGLLKTEDAVTRCTPQAQAYLKAHNGH